MSQRMAQRLSAARQRQFVGRAGEREFFRSALEAVEWPFQLLFVYGPGGVGKTTLLREYVRLCEEAGAPAVYLDARNIEAAPDSFMLSLQLALNLPPQTPVFETLASWPSRPVLLIDTFETLTPLDVWLREVFLPQLPENTLVVLAGREPPAPDWHADPGWHTLIRTLPLRNLSSDEGRAYLTTRQVPVDQQQAVLDFTHGHPLALSLVADVFAQRPDVRFQPETAPDVVRTLLAQFVQKVPGPAHRAALEACAMVRLLTEALLSEMLSAPDVRELFDWLRDLSFIESDRHGLFPHDLAREAMTADVRWRNPDWYAELHRRARNYYIARLQRSNSQEQQRILFDYVFLHRDNPVVRPYFEWQESGRVFADLMCPGDDVELQAMVARHEGDESARIAAHWLARQPQGVRVFRQTRQQSSGFMAMVALHQASPEDREVDPSAQAAWRFLQQHAPLRTGEGATLFRFWMDDNLYQAVSPTQSRVFITAVQHYLTTPGLAYTLFPCADPEFWAAVFAYADLTRIPEADFEVGGRHYGMYGHDWRATPPMTWLALLADRETGVSSMVAPPPPSEQLIVLSHDDFASAVHGALRDFNRVDALRANPLTRSRLVADRVGLNADHAKRVAALQSIVKDAAELLQSSPRDSKLYRALQATYFQPAATQEQAAEWLDLPFSTYRRHLKAGITRILDMLWQQEIGGKEL